MNSKNKKCRICFTKCRNMVMLSETISDILNVTNLKALEYVMSIKIFQNDVTPKMICVTCKSSLALAYDLKTRFEATTKKLEDLAKIPMESLKPNQQTKISLSNLAAEQNRDDITKDTSTYILIVENNDFGELNTIEKGSDAARNSKFMKEQKVIDFGDLDIKENKIKVETDDDVKTEDKKIPELKHLCTKCQKCFRSRVGLAKHIRNNVCEMGRNKLEVDSDNGEEIKAKKYQCKKCKKYFNSRPGHWKHVKNSICEFEKEKSKPITIDIPFENDVKNTPFLNDNLIDVGDLKGLVTEPKEEIEIEKKFDTNLDVDSFLSDNKNDVGEHTYECIKCKKNFKTIMRYSKHMTNVCQVKRQFTCKFCNQKFEKGHDLSNHIKNRHRQYKCKQCNFIANTYSSYYHHKYAHDAPMLQCEHCEFNTISKSSFYHHQLKHKGFKYSCELCGRKCFTITKYKSHMEKHSDDPNYICQICGKGFKQKGSLIYHKKAVHDNERNFACHYCDQRFVLKSNLNVHLLRHENSKPFKCQLCNKTFRVKNELIRHERSHTGERPYKCEFCDNGFLSSSNLANHLQTHPGPHECNLCDKTFVQTKFLKRHLRQKHNYTSTV